jgi:rhamnosyltransferase subunit B
VSRIILTTIGSKGDLHPQITIELSLRERGHDVVFATHKEYRTNIESLGFEFHPIRPDNIALNDPREMARLMDAQKGSENTIDWVFSSLRQTYTDLISVAKDADFIVAGEGVVAAPLVAEKLGISWALVVLSPISFFSAYDLPVLGLFPWLGKLRSFGPLISRRAIALIKFLTRTMSQPVHEFRRELGLPSLKNPLFDDKFSPYLNLADTYQVSENKFECLPQWQ